MVHHYPHRRYITSYAQQKYLNNTRWRHACIGFVTHDQKVPGSTPVLVALVWAYISVVPLLTGYQRLVMLALTLHGMQNGLKDPLESFEKRRALSPGSWFLSVTVMSIAV